MGNFNMLCGASQQVIQQGDRCFVLPIIQQSSYSPRALTLNGKTMSVPGVSAYHCYPDCQWTWLGNFLEAKYTDRCTFELVNTVSNQARMFFLAYTLMTTAAVAKEGDDESAFDIKRFLSDEHPALYKALGAAAPTDESDWRLVLPVNLADHYSSLASTFAYLYRGVLDSMVYVPTPRQTDTVTAVQFAVYHGVVFDKLVALGAAEKGAARAFFEKAQPQTDPKQPGGRLAAMTDALQGDLERFGPDAPEVKKMLNREVAYVFERLVGNVQQALYFAPHGQHGEVEEVAHGFAGRAPGASVEDACFAAVGPVIEARFALNAMGREHLLITPMRTCGDEGNCYGTEYAQFIQDASARVTAAIRPRW